MTINEFMTRGPITLGWEKITDKIKEGATDLVISYIDSLPIIIGVSIGVYALVGMISKTLAKLGVTGVFLYGVLVII